MKTYKKIFVSSLVAIAFLALVGNARAVTLNQTSISLNVGQSSSVYAYNVSSSLYLSNNSNPNVATVSISGSNVNIYGVMAGSTNATICDSLSGCSVLYITVNSYSNSSGTLSLSQTNISINTGQTSTITAYNNNYNYGTLYISNNSNTNVATASVSGSVITIYGNGVGSTTITICQNYNVISCGTVYVTVGNGYYNNSSSGLNLSNLTLSIGSSATISPSNNNYYSNYNYNNTGLYVSSNSNPLVASTSSSSAVSGCYGNSLYSITTGQLCNNNYYNNYSNNSILGCYAGNIYSIVTGQLCNNNYYNNYSNNYTPSYSTSYIPGCYGTNQYSITTGQSCYGGGSTNGNGSVVITAVSNGFDNITLCQNGGTCNTIYVTVTGYATPVNSSYYYGSNTPYNTYSDNSYSSTSTSGVPVIYSTSSAN
jgi:hypothetical protein